MELEEQVDGMLAELLRLELLVKQATKRIDEIRNWCKEQGSFNTKQFVCVVTQRERTSIMPLGKVAAEIGLDVLIAKNLIQTNSFMIVNVSRKGL